MGGGVLEYTILNDVPNILPPLTYVNILTYIRGSTILGTGKFC